MALEHEMRSQSVNRTGRTVSRRRFLSSSIVAFCDVDLDGAHTFREVDLLIAMAARL
jgi:hypothetical protein